MVDQIHENIKKILNRKLSSVPTIEQNISIDGGKDEEIDLFDLNFYNKKLTEIIKSCYNKDENIYLNMEKLFNIFSNENFRKNYDKIYNEINNYRTQLINTSVVKKLPIDIYLNLTDNVEHNIDLTNFILELSKLNISDIKKININNDLEYKNFLDQNQNMFNSEQINYQQANTLQKDQQITNGYLFSEIPLKDSFENKNEFYGGGRRKKSKISSKNKIKKKPHIISGGTTNEKSTDVETYDIEKIKLIFKNAFNTIKKKIKNNDINLKGGEEISSYFNFIGRELVQNESNLQQNGSAEKKKKKPVEEEENDDDKIKEQYNEINDFFYKKYNNNASYYKKIFIKYLYKIKILTNDMVHSKKNCLIIENMINEDLINSAKKCYGNIYLQNKMEMEFRKSRVFKEFCASPIFDNVYNEKERKILFNIIYNNKKNFNDTSIINIENNLLDHMSLDTFKKSLIELKDVFKEYIAKKESINEQISSLYAPIENIRNEYIKKLQ